MEDPPLGPRGLVVIGASAGGVEALGRLVSGLPGDLRAAVLVAVHVSPFARSTLPAILNRAGAMPAAQAADAEPIRPGRIYVAPPDRHLLVRSDRVRVTRGPRENGHRPAIDAMFRSAAHVYGPAVVGVVLSGILDDGSAGVNAIKRAGGRVIVQSDAAYPDMPRNAMEAAKVDHVAAVDDIADLICDLVANLPPRESDVVPMLVHDAPFQATEDMGNPSPFTCPACGGVLDESGDEPMRFRCRVGHAYGVEGLLANQSESLEASLWAALRALEERAHFFDRLTGRFTKRGNTKQAERFREDRDLAAQRAAIVRRALLDNDLVESEGPLPTSDESYAPEPTDVAG